MQKYLTAVLCLILDKVQAQGGQAIEIADFFLVNIDKDSRSLPEKGYSEPGIPRNPFQQ